MKPPTMPKVLVQLGRAIEIDGNEWEWTWNKGDKWILCASTNGRALYLFQAPKKQVDLDPNVVVKKGEKLYDIFNHRDFDKSLSGKVPALRQRAGLAHHIVYASNKFGGMAEYIHRFEKQPIVWTDNPKKPRIIALTGGSIRITKRGIEG